MQTIESVYYIIMICFFFVVGWLTSRGIKSQLVRLGDIFLFGPFLIWCATLTEPIWVKIILIGFGASTIGYNSKNYIHEEKKKNKLNIFTK